MRTVTGAVSSETQYVDRRVRVLPTGAWSFTVVVYGRAWRKGDSEVSDVCAFRYF